MAKMWLDESKTATELRDLQWEILDEMHAEIEEGKERKIQLLKIFTEYVKDNKERESCLMDIIIQNIKDNNARFIRLER